MGYKLKINTKTLVFSVSAQKALGVYNKAESTTKRSLAIYDFVAPHIRKVTIAFFITGCVLTLVFVALSILMLAKAIV